MQYRMTEELEQEGGGGGRCRHKCKYEYSEFKHIERLAKRPSSIVKSYEKFPRV
jgi:hypothetical protein